MALLAQGGLAHRQGEGHHFVTAIRIILNLIGIGALSALIFVAVVNFSMGYK